MTNCGPCNHALVATAEVTVHAPSACSKITGEAFLEKKRTKTLFLFVIVVSDKAGLWGLPDLRVRVASQANHGIDWSRTGLERRKKEKKKRIV